MRTPARPPLDGLKKRLDRSRAERALKPRDGFLRETFVLPRTDARDKAKEWFDRWPKQAYWTEIESWFERPGDVIEFTIRSRRRPTSSFDDQTPGTRSFVCQPVARIAQPAFARSTGSRNRCSRRDRRAVLRGGECGGRGRRASLSKALSTRCGWACGSPAANRAVGGFRREDAGLLRDLDDGPRGAARPARSGADCRRSGSIGSIP